jgi:hypothetical protein
MYRRGDRVIYRVTKHSSHPGRRAKDVTPEPMGEFYSYEVDKYWVVADVVGDGKLRLRTRRGKEHVVDPNDDRLRHAHWWEKLFYKNRFPQLT